VKIADSSGTNDYGLQTVRMPAAPDQTFLGSAWVYASSGYNSLCLEFWDAASGGNRLRAVCKGTTVTGQWEYLDVRLTAPAGTT